MKKNQYLKYALNPVQDFIEPARTMRDMWAGSYILSYLMASLIVKLNEITKDTPPPEFIYPFVDLKICNNGILNLINKNIKTDDKSYSIPNLPNAFLVRYNGEFNLIDIAIDLDKYLAKKLKEFASSISEKIISSNIKVAKFDKTRFLKQTENILKSQWYVLDANNAEKEESIESIEKLFAASKNTRTFNSWADATGWNYGENFEKDHLNGKEEVVFKAPQDDVQKFFKKNEALGATTLIKRMFEFAYLKPKYNDYLKLKYNDATFFETRYDNDNDSYYAIFAVDGDDMGKLLSGKKNLNGNKHSREEISEKLLDFSNSTREIVEKNDGFLIYSGGDDVLAKLPVKKAITCILDLKDKFTTLLPGTTISAGIAITHTKMPLQSVVKEARNAEKRAKGTLGKNAIAISILKRSGEIIHTGFKFDENGLCIHNLIMEYTSKNILSNGLSYKILKALDIYQNKSVNPKSDKAFDDIQDKLYIFEFERMLDQDENLRQQTEEKKKDVKERLQKEFEKFVNTKKGEMLFKAIESLFLFIAWQLNPTRR